MRRINDGRPVVDVSRFVPLFFLPIFVFCDFFLWFLFELVDGVVILIT